MSKVAFQRFMDEIITSSVNDTAATFRKGKGGFESRPHYFSYTKAHIREAFKNTITNLDSSNQSKFYSIVQSEVQKLAATMPSAHFLKATDVLPEGLIRGRTIRFASFKNSQEFFTFLKNNLAIQFAKSGLFQEAELFSDSSNIHRGHVVGAATVQATSIASFLESSGLSDFAGGKAVINRVHRNIRELKRLDFEAFSEKKIASSGALSGRYGVIILEPGASNTESGGFAGAVADKLRKRVLRDIGRLYTLHGSKSLEDLAEDAIVESIKHGRVTPKYSRTRVKTKKKIRRNTAGILVAPIFKPLKDVSTGKFTSVINIKNLINGLLASSLKENMIAPRLRYRSGRFADSVRVTDVTRTRDGELTAYYTYMKYPYQTFEVGHRQGTTLRDPRTLIDSSIRDIATSIVSNKLRTIRV